MPPNSVHDRIIQLYDEGYRSVTLVAGVLYSEFGEHWDPDGSDPEMRIKTVLSWHNRSAGIRNCNFGRAQSCC